MRIARVITRLNVGGPSIQAITLTSRFTGRGHATLLLHGRLGEGEGDMRYLAAADDALVYVPSLCRPISPLDDARAVWRLYRDFRRFRPTIVHTHMAKAGMLGRLAARAYNLTRGGAPRARVVHTYHGHVLEGYFGKASTAVFIGLERTLARATDAIIAISPAIQRELIEVYRIGRPEQYRVVRLGFDLSPFAAVDDRARAVARRALDLPEHARVVSTVGRLTAIKQHRLFLDVVKIAAATHPDIVALIAGDGELRGELEAHASAAGLRDHVRFLGWRRDLTTIYGATDVFLLTSRNEGTPVALIEAMASGVPGVSTDVGGVKDVIDSPEVGVLAPAGDAGALAAGLSGLLGDPDARATTGARARESVLARFSLDRLVADLDAVYHDLLSRR